MARIRTVKPDFFRHELLQELEVQHSGKYPMFVFEGLWGHCDSNGVFKWRPKQLKLDILPFIPFDMEETLNVLLEARQIMKATIDNQCFGFIPTFRLHQRLTGKEAIDGIRYPCLPEWETMVKQQGNNGENLGNNGERLEFQEKEGKGKGKGKDSEVSPDVKIFIDYAYESFQKTFGEKLLIDGKKDGAIVKKLLGTYDLTRLKGLWDVFMRSDDSFIRQAGRSIGVFKSQINKLILTIGKKPESEKSIPQKDDVLSKIQLEQARIRGAVYG